MREKVECLLLDLGEIIFRLDFSRLVGSMGKGLESTKEAVDYLNRWELYDRFERGMVSIEDFEAAFLKRFPLSKAEFHETWNSVVVGLIPGIEEALAFLSRQWPLYVLSNTNPLHIRLLFSRYQCWSHFQKVFTSCELAARKPEKEIYQKVADTLGVSPGKILFIDDRRDNVEGARLAGMKAEVCLQSPGELLEIARRYDLGG